ncbi:MAG: hypothetical protein R6V47_03975 [Candidatus Delongbacteria bacterium]
MAVNMYVRGNGTKTLKKNISVFGLIFRLTFFSVMLGLYVVLQSQVKLISRETSDLTEKKKLLTERLERLTAANDKMLSYSSIKEYAQKELKMEHTPLAVKSFTVLDRNGYFIDRSVFKLPELFDTEINLAQIQTKDIYIER